MIKITDSTTDPKGLTPIDTNGDGMRDTKENSCYLTGIINGGAEEMHTLFVTINKEDAYSIAIHSNKFKIQLPLEPTLNIINIIASSRDTIWTTWPGFK